MQVYPTYALCVNHLKTLSPDFSDRQLPLTEGGDPEGKPSGARDPRISGGFISVPVYISDRKKDYRSALAAISAALISGKPAGLAVSSG